MFYFHPYLGKISNLTIVFFRWVGSTTNQLNVGDLIPEEIPGTNLSLRAILGIRQPAIIPNFPKRTN